jgi:hypothetical protein
MNLSAAKHVPDGSFGVQGQLSWNTRAANVEAATGMGCRFTTVMAQLSV